MASLVPETVSKVFTAETLKTAAKQSQGIHLVSLRLRRAIKRYLRDEEKIHMGRKVLRLSESFCRVKEANLLMRSNMTKELVDDPFKSLDQSKRWKIKSSYGDIGLEYRDDETIAYIASRMPAVYSACHRVLREVRNRLPAFSPTKVLDFGSGPGTAFWALREVWPRPIERVNFIEPSKTMQRTCQRLLQGVKDLPLIQSYDSIQAMSKTLGNSERMHDLVIASYVLGEIPSVRDRITMVRQLWDLTRDVLVLVEPGTPQGSKIITQMRSHILWMTRRKCRKSMNASKEMSKETQIVIYDDLASRHGAYVVAPCPHDGVCPLEKSTKFCHFVQRLERTSSQRAYKRSKGEPLRGFEDEKFCFVALRRGKRPQGPWPLDGMKFETLKEIHARRNPEDLVIDYEDQFETEDEDIIPYEEDERALALYASDTAEIDVASEHEEEEEEGPRADLGSGWGRIIFTPQRRGKRVEMDVCHSTKRDGSEGAFKRIVVTQSKSPTLHRQARKSLWGDLWPF